MATTINAGRVAMVPKGDWSASTAYSNLDIVTHNGSSWICIQSNTGNEPASGSAYWQLSAQKGEDATRFLVTITYSGTYSADKTLAQIIAANTDGDIVVAKYGTTYYNLVDLTSESALFGAFGGVTDTLESFRIDAIGVYYNEDVYQQELVSGTNIKTINNQSLLGSGNISIGGGGQVREAVIGKIDANEDFYRLIGYNQLGRPSYSPTKDTPSNIYLYVDLPTGKMYRYYDGSDWAVGDSHWKPFLATVATSGSYNDLTNKPTIPAAQVNADWNASSGVAAILNKPTIPTVTDNLTSTSVTDALSANQGKTLKGMLDTYCPIIEDARSGPFAEIPGVAPFDTLVKGQRIVLHLNGNAISLNQTLNLTLNDGTITGAKPIKIRVNSGFATLGAKYICLKNDYLPLVYCTDENAWLMLGNEKDTTYTTITQAEINAGTETGNRVVTPALLVDNFEKRRKYVDNSADASVQLSVTTYNDLGTLSSWKTITLPASYDRADEFVFRFVCGDASLTPTLPSGVVMADNFDFGEMAVGVTFQVSIVDGIAAYLVLTPNP